ncbi:MAG: AbrB/MazE/SpoVT family DNA-binding domain-containing protein [Verrucomicrobia bacterium]|nr:AbrB/MazE/SpoVT family DNA-binding domain-containing protein [Verrucomicrobiota bacterium]MCG2681875.1 AbrB/MazE/SpoVT family DNA-binding domain-containing protein [Kiritimatiellia bacterium]MBU4247975.1 AbrB/MazE/SpoVT family DNA-binding domain-containing protein [Verrucomicrobiota bacterium]MBU4291792.1 AbrB/MazE/SpoVT family DNA-binding domain-containing protein [Verrucomicrobiota bacterium]MBU4430111.1 AbrB/MazE/SpoVT family DNA-binding domain-containing protein [Verrucomicrobiota bacter
MTSTATVTSKGQITIPRKVREALGVHEGDLLVFQTRPRGVIELKPARSATRLKGLIRPWIAAKAPSPSLKDMDDAILNGMRQAKG